MAGCTVLPQKKTESALKIGDGKPASVFTPAQPKAEASLFSAKKPEGQASLFPSKKPDAKDKEGPKRPPKAETVIAIGQMREGEADKSDDQSMQMKLYDQARQMYQHALKLDARNNEALQSLARLYAKMGDYEHAFETYDKMLTAEPKDHRVWHEAGMCFNRQKKFSEACQCFQKALELDPENRQYMQAYGFTLARAGNPDDAVFVLTKATGAGHAHYNVARMMRHIGQPAVCQKHLQLALQANPNLEEARALLARMQAPPAPFPGQLAPGHVTQVQALLPPPAPPGPAVLPPLPPPPAPQAAPAAPSAPPSLSLSFPSQ